MYAEETSFHFCAVFVNIFCPFRAPSGQAEIKSVQDDVQQWNLPEGAIRRLSRGQVSEIAYSPDGRTLAVAGSIGIWIYDARTLNPVKLLIGHTDSVWSVSFSPDENIIASGIGDGTVLLWDVSAFGTEKLTVVPPQTPRRAGRRDNQKRRSRLRKLP